MSSKHSAVFRQRKIVLGSIPKPVSEKEAAMRARNYIKLACAVLVMLALSLCAFSSANEQKSRSFEFTYSTTIKDIPAKTKKLSLWIPLPASSEYQTISGMTIDAPLPYTITKDAKYNNTILNAVFKNPSTDTLTVTLKFNATRKEHLASFKTSTASASFESKSALLLFLKPSQKVAVTPQIKKMAKDITAGRETSLEKIRALYDYVAGFMKYDKTGTGWGNGDVQFCLLEKRGNCTDYHSFYSALAISLGIPTRFAIGFPVPRDKQEGEIGGYHCWAESYVEGEGWVPMDISEGDKNVERYEYFFGAHDENRVQFTVGRDIILNPKQAGKPLNYFIYPYVEIDGQVYKNVENKFSFKDLPQS